ncbi:uncharacterized protein LOC132699973 isoform X2 [Cylas formicarius]|uniref:uncharacterized protein LOC132699973 isoform X2 n=1 Tax=Cylas formicarius TaxID=197179 RepID=UPI002958CBA2|nr:uncharacterized protein LOC132699973 isoform X2 [Cylas formicarius]
MVLTKNVNNVIFPGPFANRDNQPVLKQYSGRRVENGSFRMVYFHDQAIAVVELGPKKLLLNCEIIEVYEPDQYLKVLGDFHSMARPVGITFPEMLTLMDQCKELEDIKHTTKHEEETKNSTSEDQGRSILTNDPFTLLRGIIPGTKWCGTGDIAKDYFDLGAETKVDSCCRNHDLCPVKIRGRSQRYNLTNNSIYTKSHCSCDDKLFHCLKTQQSPIANFMGNIYFNVARVQCVRDGKNGNRNFGNVKHRF